MLPPLMLAVKHFFFYSFLPPFFVLGQFLDLAHFYIADKYVMMKCRYRCAYSRGRKKERCVCVYKNLSWMATSSFLSVLSVCHDQWKRTRRKRMIIKKRQREIQNAKRITNKKREKKRFFFCPKNVDSLCRFHLPFLFIFFFLIFQPKNSPFQFPTGFECSQF